MDNHDHSDVDEEVEQEVRLVRSVVNDEFTQTSEKKEIKKGHKIVEDRDDMTQKIMDEFGIRQKNT